MDLPGGTVARNLPANAGDMGSIPSPGDPTSLCAITTESVCHKC